MTAAGMESDIKKKEEAIKKLKSSEVWLEALKLHSFWMKSLRGKSPVLEGTSCQSFTLQPVFWEYLLTGGGVGGGAGSAASR